MSIATMDQMLNAMGNNRQRIPFAVTGATTIAGAQYSYWRLNGANKDVGARALVPTVCDNNTLGSLTYDNATLGNTLHVARVNLLSNVVCEAIFSDRIAHVGTVNMATTTIQTVGLDLRALAASDNNATNVSNRIGKSDYSEVIWRLEAFTSSTAGSTAITPLINYTNHLGVAKTTTVSIAGGALPQHTSVLIIPQSGDYIRSIESITIGTTTGASGQMSIVACNDRFSIALPAINNMIVQDWEALGLVRIIEDSCLTVFVSTTVTTAPTVSGTLMFIQG